MTTLQHGMLPDDLLTSEPDTHTSLVLYLRDLARTRKAPLSVPLVFNALAFRYDLQQRRYDLSGIRLDELPVVATGRTVDALPVGAFAQLATGGEVVACEVVYRHAEHPALTADGTCPGWLSGAPVGAEDPAVGDDPANAEVVVTERLVVDAAAFASGDPERLRRLYGRALTPEGHLLLRAAYADTDQAELDDTRLFVSYLLRQRAFDVADLLRPIGPVGTPDELADTVHAVLDILAVLLDATGMLRGFGHYLHPDSYTYWLSEAQPWRTVEPDDVTAFTRRVAIASVPVARKFGVAAASPSYVALGPALRVAVAGSDDPDQPVSGLRGVSYAITVACAQQYMTDTLTSTGGVVTVSGQQVHVGLDDAWQGGSIWRGHVPLAGEEPPDDPRLPLALGWLTAIGDHTPPAPVEEATPDPVLDPDPDIDETVRDEQPEPEPELEDDPELDGDALDRWINDTTLSWQFHLRRRHISSGVLPLTPKVAAAMRNELPPNAAMRVDLHHPGTELPAPQRRQPVEVSGNCLRGLSWPGSMFTGITLTASWSVDSFTVAVSSTALAEPVDVDGLEIDYAFNAELLLRSLGDTVDLSAEPDLLSRRALRALLQQQGRRGVEQGALFVPLRELVTAARIHARRGGKPVPTYAEVHDAVVEHTSSTDGAVKLSWGVLVNQRDGTGPDPWLAPRWPKSADPDWRTEPTEGSSLEYGDPAVVLSLHPQGSDRPSRQPAVDSGISRSSAQYLRRGHIRVLTGGRTPHQRELAIAYARVMGWDESTVSPRATFVHPTRPRDSQD